MPTEFVFNPHRSKYKLNREADSCVFCTDRIHDYKIYEGHYWVVRANSYPFIDMALLIIPKFHVEYIHQLDPKKYGKQIEELFKIKHLLASAWDKYYREGDFKSEQEEYVSGGESSYNFYINNGEYSGQSVRHMHFHFIPRVRERVTIFEMAEGNEIYERHDNWFSRIRKAVIVLLGGDVPSPLRFRKVKKLPEETADLFKRIIIDYENSIHI